LSNQIVGELRSPSVLGGERRSYSLQWLWLVGMFCNQKMHKIR